MLLTNDEAGQLKSWLVKELESHSEADSQILSDYVVALLQAEGSEGELRANAIENLTDFLGSYTKQFVQHVFAVLKSKKYVPGAAKHVPAKPEDRLHAGKPFSTDAVGNTQEAKIASKNRKRNYDDFKVGYVDWDAPNGSEGRGAGQAGRSSRRRKDGKRGRVNIRSTSNAGLQEVARETPSNDFRTSARNNGSMGKQPGSFDNRNHTGDDLTLPSPDLFTGLPDFSGQLFDPNEALRALMTLQAMGFPLPFPGDPATGASTVPQAVSKSQKPCRDYEKNGVCLRGVSCRFQHRGHKVQGNVESLHLKPRRKKSSTAREVPSHSELVDGSHGQTSSTIVVTDIPQTHLNEASVRGFFSDFGAIVSVEIRLGENLAVVDFEDGASAKTAIESPRSIFDNRFVQVSWYEPDVDDRKMRPRVQDGSSTNGISFDKERFEAQTAEAQKKYEARKALLEEMQLRKRELATKEQEIETLKASELQKMCEILATKGQSLPSDLQQFLDTSSGNRNTETLLAQLKALEDEAKNLGLDHNSWYHHSSSIHHNNYAHRGRGAYRGAQHGYPARGRGSTWIRGVTPGNGAYNLDNRPKQIRLGIADLDAKQNEHLTQFLSALAGFNSLNHDLEGEADNKLQIVTFTDRRAAEAFFYSSNDIPNVGPVTKSWVTLQTAPPTAGNEDEKMISPTEVIDKPPAPSPVIAVESADQREQRDDAGYASEEYEWIV